MKRNIYGDDVNDPAFNEESDEDALAWLAGQAPPEDPDAKINHKFVAAMDEFVGANIWTGKPGASTEAEMDQYADILSTVVENGRLSETWDDDELEVEIDHECRERDMDAEQTTAAIAYAKAHIQR